MKNEKDLLLDYDRRITTRIKEEIKKLQKQQDIDGYNGISDRFKDGELYGLELALKLIDDEDYVIEPCYLDSCEE